ncbi:MAG: deoxyribodipyrimidine photo-lyase, partial [Chromatocurvus sp.]
MTPPLIFWFRQDLRTVDLPGLNAAAATGRPLLALYILDEHTPGTWAPGGASRWWLHHSLAALAEDLRECGTELVLRRGDAASVLDDIIAETGADAVYCSRQYEPWASELEQKLHTNLEPRGIEFKRFPGHLLHEPGSVRTGAGDPFRVFTPFWRACRALPDPPEPKSLPHDTVWHTPLPGIDDLSDWDLLPHKPDWAASWPDLWDPGAQGATRRLRRFLEARIAKYGDQRDIPAVSATSGLSPHLHHGEISPRSVWHATRAFAAENPAAQEAADKFLAELGWREFSYHLLTFFPEIHEKAFKPSFEDFPWAGTGAQLKAWQRGQTGYPIVDAGMRELWATGYMHNRVRMVTASFLTKHLLIDWRAGERWFWDTLVDADLASNSASWQWVAGSGADAAPYFRIFNPTTQGEKFDATGDYVRRWVPELKNLPDKHLHKPWEAPEAVLQDAGISLGDEYPQPLVDHREAREAALAAYG